MVAQRGKERKSDFSPTVLWRSGKLLSGLAPFLASCWLGWLRLRSQNYKAREGRKEQEFAYRARVRAAPAEAHNPRPFYYFTRRVTKGERKERMEGRYIEERHLAKKFSSLNASVSD
jgi:hypothetical protein